MLRWSDDGGYTWSNEYWADVGPRGQYNQRAIWRRLGRSRNRVWEVAMTDPVPMAWIEALLDVEPEANAQ